MECVNFVCGSPIAAVRRELPEYGVSSAIRSPRHIDEPEPIKKGWRWGVCERVAVSLDNPLQEAHSSMTLSGLRTL